MNIGDVNFIRNKLMPWCEVDKLYIAQSNSEKKWPDIWVEMRDIPMITVTQEWARQSMHERRKRLVHEIIGHLKFGWAHNDFMDKVGFSTYPDKDTMSKEIYNDLLRGQIKRPHLYIKRVLK